jgi:hypothetical protein
VSYDLMVFDVQAAPRDRPGFLAWWGWQSRWCEGHGYDDPAVTAPALRAWFLEMIQHYPPMNGPLAPQEDPDDDTLLTDYAVGRSVIYGAFAWSQAQAAREKALSLAGRHGVGVFEAASNAAPTWWPDGAGGLTLAHVGDSSAD